MNPYKDQRYEKMLNFLNSHLDNDKEENLTTVIIVLKELIGVLNDKENKKFEPTFD